MTTLHRAGIALITLSVSTGIVGGQAPTDVLVIDGGTLIDGNGGAPVREVRLRGVRETSDD